MADEKKIPEELNEEELADVSGGKLNLFKRKRKMTVTAASIVAKKGERPANVPEDYIQWECPQSCDVVVFTEPDAQAPLCPKHQTKCMRIYGTIQF